MKQKTVPRMNKTAENFKKAISSRAALLKNARIKEKNESKIKNKHQSNSASKKITTTNNLTEKTIQAFFRVTSSFVTRNILQLLHHIPSELKKQTKQRIFEKENS